MGSKGWKYSTFLANSYIQKALRLCCQYWRRFVTVDCKWFSNVKKASIETSCF